MRIGPSLLGRRQRITINVLTDGDRPSLSCCSPLIDIQVRERLGDNPDWTSAAAIIAGWAVAVLLAVTAENFALQKSAGWAAVAAAGAATAALLATMILWSSRWRKLTPCHAPEKLATQTRRKMPTAAKGDYAESVAR